MEKITNTITSTNLQTTCLLIICSILTTVVVWGCGETKSSLAERNILVSDTLKMSQRIADSEIYRRGLSLDYNPDNPSVKWNYQTGLFLKSLLDLGEASGRQKYYDFAKRVTDSFIQENGTIKTYKIEDYNIDHINPGKVLLKLYKTTGDTTYKKTAGLLRKQLENHPRTKAGGFWHKKRYPWQMWLDGIYMGAPFYTEYSQLFNQPKGFEDVIKQVLLIDVHTRDPKTGLRYHAWDESSQQEWANPETGCSTHFWGRAMGWYAMALVDILDFLPEDYPKRDKLLFILNDLMISVAKYQDENSGLWFQVLDQGERAGNYLEASASSMFVYALTKAVNKQYINSSYKVAAEKGYNGILKKLVRIDKNGLVNLTQICSVAGLGGNPYRDGSYEYYLSEPVVENDLKGIGPFILACLEMEKLNKIK
ncbi:MAG: glycoside hydrolase family 88 protein [Calditrichaceae bacterium]|nr:glycoside hydrolase family 88 protein [Calditrichaceae bacterium]MBN2710362.1 glycoside hydrolase family 88 protein [Calditrichaceae bacterium]RQV95111.1 MAG: glycosyl hydrolase family 88 [Calditrichota bacterium]